MPSRSPRLRAAACALALSLAACIAPASAQSLTPNSGFESGSSGWKLFVPERSANAGADFTVVEDSTRPGNHVASLFSRTDARYGIIGRGISAAPGERYRVSVRVRAGADASFRKGHPGPVIRLTFRDLRRRDPAGGHYYIGLGDWVSRGVEPPPAGRRPPTPRPPSEWTEIQAVVEIPADVYFVYPVLFAWGTSGAVWFDDFDLELVPADTPLSPVIQAKSADTSATATDEARAEALARGLPAVSPVQVDAIAALLPAAPGGHFLPPFADRAHWDAIAALPVAPALLDAARKHAAEPIPVLSEELHADFLLTGRRKPFETPFQLRLARLESFTLAEGLENRGQWLPAIEAELAAILAEPSWAWPAHTRSRPTWASARDYIDLSAASRAWSLATADWLLGDRLHPRTRDRLRSEIRERVLAPWIERVRAGDKRDFWWMDANHNWNAVCNSGVLGVALLQVGPVRERAEFAAAYAALGRVFLGGFAEDGFCHEGISYWGYGFGHYVLGAEALRHASEGKIDLLAEPRVRRIAAFARDLQIADNVYPAFGDAAIHARPPGWLTDFVAAKLGGSTGPDAAGPDAAERLYATLLNLALARPPASPAVVAALPLRGWFPEGGALVSRQRSAAAGLSAAFKGGHNGQPHNHNDLGSFVLLHGGQPILTDLGHDDYVKDTFGPARYTSAMMNSLGHPVPLVDGGLQKTGEAARAVTVRTEFSEDSDLWEIDLTGAYDATDLQRLTRTFRLVRSDDGGRLEIEDRVSFRTPRAFGSALILLPGQSWTETAPGLLRVNGGGRAPGLPVEVRITATGGAVAVNETPVRGIVPDLPPKGQRLGLDFTAPVTEAVLRLVITPAAPI